MAHKKHWLHSGDRNWPQSNCSVDLWIELLHSWGYEPVAALAFTLNMEYEDDQFTFYKMPTGDLLDLYGVRLLELSIYDNLERHVATQVSKSNVVLVETDGFYLPDTAGVTYKTGHAKTTIGIDSINLEKETLTYFHNDAWGELAGDDYRHVMYKADRPILFPYVEFAKRGNRTPATVEHLRQQAEGLLNKYARIATASIANPVAGFRRAFEAHVAGLSNATFHEFAFNHFRMLGSNFEYLGSFLAWLGDSGLAQYCQVIALQTKSMQFKTARMVARGKFDPCNDAFDEMEGAWQAIMDGLR